MWEPFGTVYRRYLSEAQRVDGPNKNILKLDCHNEAEDQPPPSGIATMLQGNVTLLELAYNTMMKAGRKYPELNIWHGDIRRMPFPAANFDVLLDLSTIDHIDSVEVPLALDEYKRVLKPGGDLVLVSWVGEYGDGKAPNLVYHQRQTIVREIESRFTVTYMEILMTSAPWDLVLWRCMA
jgi:SAM-dependent methyltransferase